MVYDDKISDKEALKVKEWEVGMWQDEVAASQGIKIRRRPPTGPPVHYVGPFEFRSQNEGNTPSDILEEIVWYKDLEVSQVILIFGDVHSFGIFGIVNLDLDNIWF